MFFLVSLIVCQIECTKLFAMNSKQSEYQKNSLEEFSGKKIYFDCDDDCPICLEKFKVICYGQKDKVKIVVSDKCGHCVCQSCLKEVKEYKKGLYVCPICRSEELLLYFLVDADAIIAWEIINKEENKIVSGKAEVCLLTIEKQKEIKEIKEKYKNPKDRAAETLKVFFANEPSDEQSEGRECGNWFEYFFKKIINKFSFNITCNEMNVSGNTNSVVAMGNNCNVSSSYVERVVYNNRDDANNNLDNNRRFFPTGSSRHDNSLPRERGRNCVVFGDGNTVVCKYRDDNSEKGD